MSCPQRIFCATALVLAGALTLPSIAQEPCGGWSIFDSPNPGMRSNTLTGIAAISSDDVWAVGVSVGILNTELLFLNWNGSTWTQHPAPGTNGTSPQLKAIDAKSSDNLWAVGSQVISGLPQGLAMRWNGDAWTEVDLPRIPGGSSLNAVEAVSPTEVWAVGSRAPEDLPGLSTVPYCLRYNGETWEEIYMPEIGTRSHDIIAVSSAGPDDVWAVGNYRNTLGGYRAYIIHWDGQSWQKTPNPSETGVSSLFDVDAIGPNDIWAVGDAAGAPLFLHWGGEQWTRIPSPGGGFAVAGTANNNVWSVGSNGSIVHFDGDEWSTVTTPFIPGNPSLPTGGLSLSGECDGWAAGAVQATLQPARTLVLRLGALQPPPCRANWDGDEFLDATDFNEFIMDLLEGDADFNSDGVTNSDDFWEFLTAFFAGCP